MEHEIDIAVAVGVLFMTPRQSRLLIDVAFHGVAESDRGVIDAERIEAVGGENGGHDLLLELAAVAFCLALVVLAPGILDLHVNGTRAVGLQDALEGILPRALQRVAFAGIDDE